MRLSREALGGLLIAVASRGPKVVPLDPKLVEVTLESLMVERSRSWIWAQANSPTSRDETDAVSCARICSEPSTMALRASLSCTRLGSRS